MAREPTVRVTMKTRRLFFSMTNWALHCWPASGSLTKCAKQLRVQTESRSGPHAEAGCGGGKLPARQSDARMQPRGAMRGAVIFIWRRLRWFHDGPLFDLERKLAVEFPPRARRVRFVSACRQPSRAPGQGRPRTCTAAVWPGQAGPRIHPRTCCGVPCRIWDRRRRAAGLSLCVPGH